MEPQSEFYDLFEAISHMEPEEQNRVLQNINRRCALPIWAAIKPEVTRAAYFALAAVMVIGTLVFLNCMACRAREVNESITYVIGIVTGAVLAILGLAVINYTRKNKR